MHDLWPELEQALNEEDLTKLHHPALSAKPQRYAKGTEGSGAGPKLSLSTAFLGALPSRKLQQHRCTWLSSEGKGAKDATPPTRKVGGEKSRESTHRPLSSFFLWFIFRILQGNPKKGLLRGLWVEFQGPRPSAARN